jgi:hypothetical protein
VLVGMSKRMVLAAMGAPNSKDREHVTAGDENSPRYEEWIYGEVPQPIQFVRFRNERVVRLEIAELGKPIEVRVKNEVGTAQLPENVHVIASGDAQPTEEGNRPGAAPTLRKPGEESPGGMGPVAMPGDSKPTTAGPPQHFRPDASTPASL